MAIKLADIAGEVGGEVEGNPELQIRNVARIEEAGEGDITFLINTKYTRFLATSGASAVIVPRKMDLDTDKTLLRADNPYFTFLKVVTLFYPPKPPMEPGIHPTAIIDESSEIGPGVAVGPYVVIGKACRIGKGTALLAHTVLEDNVTVGSECCFHARVTVRHQTVIGNRVILHSGVVIGSDGFGFAPQAGVYYKIPQVGRVIIEDDVEIGANVTVDRATLGETTIKKGVKLDNLIQVGHNCTIGENTVIAAQSGLSGSTHIGKGVRVGGQVGFAGHMTIGDGAALGAKSGVSKSVPPGQFFSGIPARPHMDNLRMEAATARLADKLKEIKKLKKRIENLEKRLRDKC